jgi:hypothetical protein
MTKSAQQLLWDKEFIEKRIQDQKEYFWEITNRYDGTPESFERVRELCSSAQAVLRNLDAQLIQINKLK